MKKRLFTILAGAAVVVLASSSNAWAAYVAHDTGTYTSHCVSGYYTHSAQARTDTVTHKDQLTGAKAAAINGAVKIVRLRVNEATIGQENWKTVADITFAPSTSVSVGTTGSEWRSPGGKVAWVIWPQGGQGCATTAVNYNWN